MGCGNKLTQSPFLRITQARDYADCHVQCGQLVHEKQGPRTAGAQRRPQLLGGEGGGGVGKSLARPRQPVSRATNMVSGLSGKENPMFYLWLPLQEENQIQEVVGPCPRPIG